MGQPELARPDRYAKGVQRLEGRAEINAAIALWIGHLTIDEAIERCDRAGVPCGPILSIDDIFENPQYAARENLQRIEHPGVGEVVVPAAVPRLTATPARLRHLGRAMGFDTDAVFEELLGLSAERVAELRGQGVV